MKLVVQRDGPTNWLRNVNTAGMIISHKSHKWDYWLIESDAYLGFKPTSAINVLPKPSYLCQLDPLTHEDGDLRCQWWKCGSVSVGVRAGNKAETELCNTPFHWSLSSLSATATGGKSHLPALNMCSYLCLSLPDWVCHIVFNLSHCVRNTQRARATRWGVIQGGCAFAPHFCNSYWVTKCYDGGEGGLVLV